jgi:hypothetical protein
MNFQLIHKSGMTEDVIAASIDGVKDVIAILGIQSSIKCVMLDGNEVLHFPETDNSAAAAG